MLAERSALHIEVITNQLTLISSYWKCSLRLFFSGVTAEEFLRTTNVALYMFGVVSPKLA